MLLLHGRSADHVDRARAVLTVGLRRRGRPRRGAVAVDRRRVRVPNRVGRVTGSHAAADGDGAGRACQRGRVAVSKTAGLDSRLSGTSGTVLAVLASLTRGTLRASHTVVTVSASLTRCTLRASHTVVTVSASRTLHAIVTVDAILASEALSPIVTIDARGTVVAIDTLVTLHALRASHAVVTVAAVRSVRAVSTVVTLVALEALQSALPVLERAGVAVSDGQIIGRYAVVTLLALGTVAAIDAIDAVQA